MDSNSSDSSFETDLMDFGIKLTKHFGELKNTLVLLVKLSIIESIIHGLLVPVFPEVLPNEYSV